MSVDFDRLENAIKKEMAQEKAATLFSHARANLVLGSDPNTIFFAALALKLTPLQDWEIDTACTDGKGIRYNPEWFNSCSMAEAKGVLCHEVLHVALKHHTRCGDRDQENWGIACDLVVNPILQDAGLTVRADGLMPGRGKYAKIPKGLSAEEVYELLKQNKGKKKDMGQGASTKGNEGAKGDSEESEDQEGGGNSSAGKGGSSDPGDMGTCEMPGDGSNAAKAQAEAEVDVAVAQAEQLAKKRGSLSAGLDRLVSQAIRPKVDWHSVLREFVTQKAKDEYRWSPPNRHFVHQDMYLPSRSGEALGDITVALDTSGSIGENELKVFAGAMEGIVEAYSCKLRIVYHDDKVCHVQEWEPSDGPLVLEPKGGGGTSHIPVFEDIEAQPDAPVCVVCFTDLYTEFPPREPPMPTLWCVLHGREGKKAPFGQTLEIEL